MDDRSIAQIAPSGDFATNGPFNCSNPLMSGAEASFLGCTGTAGTTDPSVLILRRDVEGGNRQQSFEHMDFREVLGIKGKMDDVWSYDASFNYSLVNLNSDALNYFSSTKLTNALNVTGTSAATAACTIGPPCVPYNLFANRSGDPGTARLSVRSGHRDRPYSAVRRECQLHRGFGQVRCAAAHREFGPAKSTSAPSGAMCAARVCPTRSFRPATCGRAVRLRPSPADSSPARPSSRRACPSWRTSPSQSR